MDVTEITQKRRLAEVQTLDAISVPPRQESDWQLRGRTVCYLHDMCVCVRLCVCVSNQCLEMVTKKISHDEP